ncbi:hypothetical protein DSC45_01510 [Streptomyces sp. YIM 130001]|uniref:hypothetical protein n=1 Tax=Streptomyces sp. YIM 130001 TaxID=2259644 RepID=UPI000EEB918A|nr:hypothetical protein [Streptomyces sp. YIM 130001]RII21068.1 hypothetical protein DSC45_01510 [Streptomyces sp. YIM 130001]
MRRSRAWVCLLLGAVLVGGATACTGGGADGSGERAEGSRRTVAAESCMERYGHPNPAAPGYVAGLTRDGRARYQQAAADCRGGRKLSAAELREIGRAEQTLVGRCMRRAGFAYWAPPAPSAAELRKFPHVLDDVNWAEAHGYGRDLERRRSASRDDNPNTRYADALPSTRERAYDRALNGDRDRTVTVTAPNGDRVVRRTTGCRAAARGGLYGDVAAWTRVTAVLEHLPDTSKAVTDSAAYRRDVRAWSVCMREDAGYAFNTPRQARDSLESGAASRADETRLAIAEARCARSSGLARTVAGLERQALEQSRLPYQDTLKTRTRLQLAALDRARAVNDGGGQGVPTGRDARASRD